jgi:hypothetical protein
LHTERSAPSRFVLVRDPWNIAGRVSQRELLERNIDDRGVNGANARKWTRSTLFP